MKSTNKAHKNIVNKTPNILLIGYGWVGQFLAGYFKEADYVDDTNVVRKVKDNKKVAKKKRYRYAFISVPTPMLPSGQCDTSIVELVVKKWRKQVDYFCIKSTVEVGTIDRLIKKYHIKACMSPEYLGETIGHPLVDPIKNTFVILGGKSGTTKKFARLWTLVTNSYTKIFQVSAKAAELCKLMENSFLAAKVMFVNEFFALAEDEGVDYNILREIWLADPRISRDHTYVFPNNRGFSGKCLPKDLNNLVYHYKNKKGAKAKMIEFLLEYNAQVRRHYQDQVPLLPKKKTPKKK